MVKKRLQILLILISILILSISLSCSRSDSQISLVITSPSDANSHITPGHGFFVNGTISSDRELPEGVKLRVSLYSGEKELRFAQSDKKGEQIIDKFNPSLFYYADDVDPERESLFIYPKPFLIVEDVDNPQASITNANIKCYFSDTEFSSFIPYATDAEHGLIFDDGIGFRDADGNIYDALPEGEYTIVVLLSDAKGKELARCSKLYPIKSAENGLLSRFHPDEQMENMFKFAADNSISANVDWIPGYFMDPNGNERGGMRAMFLGADVALYRTGTVHMFIYLEDYNSSSLSFEVPYVEKYRNVDDPSVFVSYCYDCGEPVLHVGDRTIKGNIVRLADGDKLYLCRADMAVNPTEGYIDLADYKILGTDIDFSDGISLSGSKGGTLAICGLVAMHQLEQDEIIFEPLENKTGLLNWTDRVVYEFDDGREKFSLTKKITLTRRMADKKRAEYPSIMEFYHVFDRELIKPGVKYKVHLYGIDRKGRKVPGTEEDFELKY